MPRAIPRVVGLASVVIVGGLLGLLVFAMAQDQESDQDALATTVKVQPTDDLRAGPTVMSLEIALQDSPSLAEYYELSAPEALSSPAVLFRGDEHQISGSLTLEYDGFACSAGSPRLLFRIPEPLPPGAMAHIWPAGEWILESPGSGTYPKVGPAYESPLPNGVSAFQVNIASALANEGTKHLIVILKAPGPSRWTAFISMLAVIDVSGADCGAQR